MKLRTQLKNNQLAIISLVVALTALGYNTWRNELTEHNRNVRQAGFEILLNIAELQQITYLAHYDRNMVEGNPRKGWARVLVIKDLARLMPEPAQLQTDELALAWERNWAGLGKEDSAVAAIDAAIDETREDVLSALRELD